MRMKKLKYLLVAAVLPLMMISCWDEPEQDINDPIVAGIWLYNAAVVQSTYTLDPAAIAFRLNCLLTDKQLQGVDRLLDVKTEAEVSEMKFLFGEMTRIEENYNGVAGDYRISFDFTGDKGQSDRPRGGSVIISTGNKLLHEGMWIIENDRNSPLSYQATTSEQVMVESIDEYTIAPRAADKGLTSFVVGVKGFGCRSHLGNYTSSWTGEYSITPQFVIDPENKKVLSMAEARKATYAVSFAIQGPTFAVLDGQYQTGIRYYTIEDNIYKPACSMSNGMVYRASGEEFAELIGSYDKEAFPSSFVVVKYTPAGTECGKVNATITYNGENRVQ